MPKFTEKPVTIEAVQFLGRSPEGDLVFSEQPEWLDDALALDRAEFNSVAAPAYGPPTLLVYTQEGHMTASLHDWIIRGVKGELYPCKPEIFALTYDAVQP